MKPCRRTILKMIALLAAGAAVNVAVAWGLAVLIRDAHSFHEEQGHFLADQYGGPRVWCTSFQKTGAVRNVFQFDSHQPFQVSEKDQALFPRWSRGAEPRRINPMNVIVPHEPVDSVLVEDARGWPMLALHCEHVIAFAVDDVKLYVCNVSGGIATDRIKCARSRGRY